MPKKVYVIKLKKNEKKYLEKLIKQGKRSARETKRAMLLLLSNEGKIDKEIIDALKVSRSTCLNIRKRYCEEGLESALKEKPRPGAPIKIDSRVESMITMIACSEPPEGRSCWTMELIADRLITLENIEITPQSVSNTLKKIR